MRLRQPIDIPVVGEYANVDVFQEDAFEQFEQTRLQVVEKQQPALSRKIVVQYFYELEIERVWKSTVENES